jgi:hypothetical protein
MPLHWAPALTELHRQTNVTQLKLGVFGSVALRVTCSNVKCGFLPMKQRLKATGTSDIQLGIPALCCCGPNFGTT